MQGEEGCYKWTSYWTVSAVVTEHLTVPLQWEPSECFSACGHEHPMPLLLSSAMPITAAFIPRRDLSVFHPFFWRRWNCSCSAFIIFLIYEYYLEIILRSGSRQNIPCLTSKNCPWDQVVLASGVSCVASQYRTASVQIFTSCLSD